MKLFKENITPRLSTLGDKIYPLVVDIKKGVKSGDAVNFVTADNEVGILSIELVNGDEPYDISGCIVCGTIQRPDTSTLNVYCDIVGANKLEIPLGVSGTYQEGVHNFDLKIYRGNEKVIGVPTMSYTVTGSLSSDGVVEEEDKLPIMSNLINEVLRLNGEWDAFTDKFGDIDWEEMQNMGANSVTVNGTKYTQVDGNIALPSYPTLSSIGAEPKNSNIQAHISSTHAPSNAQKNSDITKAEIEAKLVGNITTHTHNQYLTQHQDLSHLALKTELHNHSNKSVLDNITNAKVTEWNNKSTFSGSYYDLTNKPIIPSIEGLATEDFVKNEIAKIDTSIDIVDSVEDMIDTSKQYVYSKTNTWWKYKKVTMPAGSVLPNIDNAIKWNTTKVVINKRLNSSAKEVDALGCAIFYFTFDDEMKNILNTVDPVWIRMKGCSMYATSGNNTSTKVVTWSSSGTNGITATPLSQVLMYEETKDGISSTPYPSSLVNYSDNKTAPITASKFGYMNTTTSDNSTNKQSDLYLQAIDGKLALSLIVNFASKTTITEEDLKDVYITFNESIVSYEEIVTEGWYDTGIEYNPNDDSSVVDLGIRVSELEDRVEELEKRPVGGGNTTISTLPSYWKNRLDDISPKIDALQKENGMDTLQFLWCSDIHGVSGTAPSNTTYIGEIGRYMMDKHNIPFFVVSGDIMSQASHAKEEYMWNEYAKLTTMLSPIKNEEFLAIRGNHDGVYGSPMEYNGNANQYYHSYMGDKALFNAFMRRQTLDSHRRVFGKDGMYFYVEYHNYRIYMLNTHTFGDNSTNEQGQAIYNGFKHDVFGSEQLQWVADTLNTVKENQQVIFVGHVPLNALADKEVFITMINHYIGRSSGTSSKNITGTYWGTDEKYAKTIINVDFTNAKGSVLGWFNGHIHKDTIRTDSFDKLPMFSITTAGGDLRDEYLTNGTLTRVKGTPTETAIDLVTVTSDYIYFTRIGSGYDRKYNRLTKEVTIDYDSAYIPEIDEPEIDEPEGTTNLAIPNATNTTDTSIWVNGYRFSSSGLSAQEGTSVSNKIQIKKR